jgi:tetratricopeptide (TPR) repeat protein
MPSVTLTNSQPVQKRRVALLVSMGRIQLAIGVLVDLLQISPTDAEAWAELSDLYLSQNCYDQAVFCLEEVLLVMPNAWNVSYSFLPD